MQKRLLELKDEGNLIASLVLYTVELRSRHLAVIEEVKVTEGYRNKGYGRAIIKFGIIKAREMGCETVELCYNDRDQIAKKLYESCGFIPDGNVRAKVILSETATQRGRW